MKQKESNLFELQVTAARAISVPRAQFSKAPRQSRQFTLISNQYFDQIKSHQQKIYWMHLQIDRLHKPLLRAIPPVPLSSLLLQEIR